MIKEYTTDFPELKRISCNYNRDLEDGDIISISKVDISGYCFEICYLVKKATNDKLYLHPVIPIPCKIIGEIYE